MIDDVFNLILTENPDVAARLAEHRRTQGRTPEYWQIFRLDCGFNGVALKDWTLWSLFDAMHYSNEAITMLYRVLGFNGTFLSEMNAGEAFQLLEDFPSNPGFKTLSNGFSTLPNALVDQVGKDRIYLETRVDRLRRLRRGVRADLHPRRRAATDHRRQGRPRPAPPGAREALHRLQPRQRDARGRRPSSCGTTSRRRPTSRC